MPDVQDLTPLFAESAATIRARMIRDMLSGLDPSSDAFPDTTPGGFLSDVLGATVFEVERMWDAIGTELPATTFIQYAYGDYLDERGAEVGVARNPEAYATVTLTFSGPDGTPIPIGQEIAVAGAPEAGGGADEELDDEQTIVFVTTAAGTTAGGTAAVPAIATAAGARYNVPALSLTVPNRTIADITSVTNLEAAANGADPETDEEYRPKIIEAATEPRGGGTQADLRSWAFQNPYIKSATVRPNFAGPGTAAIVIGAAGNQPVTSSVVGDLQNKVDPSSRFTTTTGTHTLPASTINVADTSKFTNGSGFIFVGNQVVTYTGLTPTSFTGCSGGAGTFVAGAPVSQGGEGIGLAAIGALVAIQTFTTVTVDTILAVTPENGYSVGNTTGLVSVGAAVQDAVRAYIDGLGAGVPVMRFRVAAAAGAVKGVRDVALPTLNGGSSNLILSPLQSAMTGTVTVTS